MRGKKFNEGYFIMLASFSVFETISNCGKTASIHR